MSVYTTLTLQEAQAWLREYSIGSVTELKGIAAGITNTNYFLMTDTARYVLTVFEKNSMDELPYFIDLMAHLAQHGVPCPTPIADNNGNSLHLLKDKPALVVSCLNGKGVEQSDADQCAQVGHALAQMHIAGQSFKHDSINQRDANWRVETAAQVIEKMPAADQSLLNKVMAFQAGFDLSALPRGVIHGDLFRDNVLFDGAQLGGFIDFYYACDDVLAYDVAIAVNDWCVGKDGELDGPRLNAFLQAYMEARPFSVAEQQAWQGLLCVAALRFWLSRLYDWHYPLEGELTHAKDPDHFKQILLNSTQYIKALQE